MKSPILLVSLFYISSSCESQNVFYNQISSVLEKVINDCPNHFKNISGNILIDSSHINSYESTVKIPGSYSCIVIKHISSKKDITRWESEVFESKSFKEGVKKHKELYNHIKNMIVKTEGEKPYILSGYYEIPNEHKKNCSIIFNFIPATGIMKNVRVELVLSLRLSIWKVFLTVYDREREDHERRIAKE